MMKSILFIANYKPGSGGISTQVEILNQMLETEGYKTAVFSLKGSALFRFMAFLKLTREGKKYDVFHVHACSGRGFLPAIIGVKVGNALGKKIILTYHGGGARSFFEKHPRLVKRYLNQTTTNIVLSGFIKTVFDQYSIPCVTIPNIIKPKEKAVRERTNLTPKFIGIRSFAPIYNVICTIKSFQIVKQRYPQATLTLLGDGPLRRELERFVDEQDIKDVLFVGRVSNDAIFDYLDKADIMLSSPLIDNMPVSLLEGFSEGLLVISSNVGGVPYMVKDGETGLLFPSEDFHTMAEKMIWALSHQEESIRMIRNAKEEVKKYTWECVGESIKVLYE